MHIPRVSCRGGPRIRMSQIFCLDLGETPREAMEPVDMSLPAAFESREMLGALIGLQTDKLEDRPSGQDRIGETCSSILSAISNMTFVFKACSHAARYLM